MPSDSVANSRATMDRFYCAIVMLIGVVLILLGCYFAFLDKRLALVFVDDPGRRLAILLLTVATGSLIIRGGALALRWKNQCDLEVDDSGVRVGSVMIPFPDIAHVRRSHDQVPKRFFWLSVGIDHHGFLDLVLRDGSVIRVGAGPRFFSAPVGTTGQLETEELLTKAMAIERATMPDRAERMALSLQQQGRILYDGKSINANGDVYFPEQWQTVNLRQMTYEPDLRCLICLEEGYDSEALRIDLAEDGDAFMEVASRQFGIRLVP